MSASGSDWSEELERWLTPFLERLGNKTRRRMCPRYVTGLIHSEALTVPLSISKAT